MTTQNFKKTTYIGRNLFFAAFCIFLVKNCISYSTIQVYFSTDSIAYKLIFRILIYGITTFKVLTQDKFSERQLLLYAGLVILSGMIFLCASSGIVIDTVWLIIAAHGVDFRSIVKVFFIFSAISTALLMLLSLSGLIINYKIYGIYGGEQLVRYSFGSVYPTDFAAKLFSIELAYAYIRKNKRDSLFLLFWVAVGVFVWFFCRARLDTILIIAFALAVFINAKFPRFYTNKIIRFSLVYSMIICCIFAVLLHALYSKDNTLLVEINSALSGRLQYGKQGIVEYGFSLFGKYFETNGNGFVTGNIVPAEEYFFIDCSFLGIALSNGVIYLVVLLCAFTVSSKKAVKYGDNILAIVISFLALTSIVDHHLGDISYNVFLFLITSVINNCAHSYRISLPECKNGKEMVI